jgi:hypothetical protein
MTSPDPMRLKCGVRMRGRGGHDLMLGWTAGSVGGKNGTVFAGRQVSRHDADVWLYTEGGLASY